MEHFSITDYLARSGASESSLRTYGKILSRCEALLGKPLEDASLRDVDRLKKHLRTMRSGPNYAAELRRFYRAAGRTDLAEVSFITQRLRRLSPDDILTLPEVNDMMRAADSLRDRALIATMWATGQRVGAIAEIRLRDLKNVPSDNGGGAIRVSFRKVKVAGQEHTSYILDIDGGDHVRAWLNAYPFDRTEEATVFPSHHQGRMGLPLQESAILKMLKGAARRAGITKRVYPHLFRHSRATHLLRLGVDSLQVKKLCGWDPGSPVLEKRYAHLVDRDAYRALLRAHGLEVPEAPDIGRLIAAEGDLKPVVPMVAPPGTSFHSISPQELAGLLGDPKVQEFLRLLDTARQPLQE